MYNSLEITSASQGRPDRVPLRQSCQRRRKEHRKQIPCTTNYKKTEQYQNERE